jgi:ribonuclease D
VTTPDRPERPTREAIAALPPFEGLPLERIVVLRSPAQCEEALGAMRREIFVGFDTETKPTFAKGVASTGPHLVQFALSDRAYLVQLGADPPLAFLAAAIGSQDVVKVGFGLASDRGPLARRLGVALGATVELTAVLRSLRYREALGAKAAVAIVLGRRLQKSKAVTTSNWAQPELRPNQLLYAANDAYAALRVFRALGSPYRPASGMPPADARAPAVPPATPESP